MRKNIYAILIVLIGTLFSFTSCSSDSKDDNSNNILAENMITLLNIKDIQVVLDNTGKTIDIAIPFEVRDSISKLTVLFNDLPSGAMVTPLNELKDFSNNQRYKYTVTFADGEQKVYSIGVTYSALQPKFNTIKLNGVAAVLDNGVYTAQLLASEDLKKVRIAYATNDPNVTVKIKNTDNDDYVALDTVTTSANSTYNFEDKANGRKFKLEFNGISNIITVKVITSGYSKLTKIWQTYANFGTPDFYGVASLAGATAGTVVPAAPSGDAWDRGIAMDDNYIYMARGNKSITAEPTIYPAYGVIAIKISDHSAKLLDRTGMYVAGEAGLGAHGTTDVNVIGGKIVACNLANSANSNLKVFVWDDVNSAPVLKLTYNVGATPNPRLGDKFSFEGDWTSGVLRFVDYNGANNRYYEFKISGGNIDPTPTIVTIPNLINTGNTAGAIYKFSASEYLFSGSGKQAVVFNPTTKLVTYATLGTSFPLSEIGDAMFTFNDKQYLAYVYQKNTGVGWALRIRPLDYSTLAESLEKVSTKALDVNLSGLLSTDVSTVSNGNSTGKVYVHTTTAGDTYILALASNQGFGLFKLE